MTSKGEYLRPSCFSSRSGLISIAIPSKKSAGTMCRPILLVCRTPLDVPEVAVDQRERPLDRERKPLLGARREHVLLEVVLVLRGEQHFGFHALVDRRHRLA